MNRFRSPFITCHGPSMSPALKDGDGLLLSACAGPADVDVGDIIVYPHPFAPYDIAHRVIEISAAGVVTRGDRNDEADPDTVPWAQIKGRVVRVARAARSFLPLPSPETLKAFPPPKYEKPGLIPMTDFALAQLACMNGNEASGNACVSGPEASGGCKSGAAASAQCQEGAAAGFNCKSGTGN